ncbi:MAG TPA: alkaline phosphatase, partial [Anaeromyxobacteraceae bacterium]
MIRKCPKLSAAFIALCAASSASAAPADVSLVPPDGARFLEHQRFDLRIEGRGAGPFSATLAVDGKPAAFTSGKQGSTETDGISSAGWGGFNRRGYSLARPGFHTLTATFSDASGATTVTSRIEVVDAGFGRRGRGHVRGAGVKNIVIMLGDGMGLAHRTAARLVKFGATRGDPNGFLAMDRFPGTGLVTTHSLNSIVTDSSPGMACYSTGNHAQNSQEGVYPAHMASPFALPRVEYMAEYLHRVKGTSLGLVSTADLEDATPAANAVHTGNRNLGTGIVDQYLDEADAGGSGRHGTGLTVLLGGGRRWFLPASQLGSSRADASDYADLPADLVAGWGLPAAAGGALDAGRDLVADFQKAGFSYVEDASGLRGATRAGQTPHRLLGLFGLGNMNTAVDKLARRRGVPVGGGSGFVVDDYKAPDQPMLPEMTVAALDVLSRNRNGFVLMVEGALIDKQSHLMDADRVIGETIEFDDAVAVTRKFAEARGDTVVLVLADHECSGFSLIGALTGGVGALRALPSDAAVLDPAAQPARQKVVGVADAASFPRYEILPDGHPASYDVDGKLLVGYGAGGDRYETWLEEPLPVIDTLVPGSLRKELAAAGYAAEPYRRGSEGKGADRNGMFIRGQAIGRDQAVHTATDIPVSAYARDPRVWQAFVGVQRNTDVFFKLMRAALRGAEFPE